MYHPIICIEQKKIICWLVGVNVMHVGVSLLKLVEIEIHRRCKFQDDKHFGFICTSVQ